MVRALWSAASGMTSQQTNVDVIANNLANVNTTGYKTQTAQFKSLLYQTLQSKTTTANGETKPVGAQVGLGTRISSISSVFKQGNMTATNIDTDFAIDGQGFFAVQGIDGDTYYTRDGSFIWALGPGGGVMLCNAEGLPVLDSTGAPIELGEEYQTSKITIDASGEVCYPDDQNNPQKIGMKIGLYQFTNAGGLERASSSRYKITDASGEAMSEDEFDNLNKSTIRQGYLEASNVQVVDEMVNLIVAQRAYEMNSKAIQAADDMMQQANNLRR
ncbi:MAG: flagellar hook-basal body protein [Lachnospiraceae bacterium]|nr:flagellar hook-basal body protein [Lachnospiraceae bacterium]